MKNILEDNEISKNIGIAIEFTIPNSSKRADFIITGKDDKQKHNAIIIELKQWTTVSVVEEKNEMVNTFMGGGFIETRHPSYQAWTYASMIEEYNETVKAEQIGLYPCAHIFIII